MDHTGCSNSPLQAYECLQDQPWETIVNISPRFKARGSIDGQRSANPVLPNRPELLMADGDFNKVVKQLSVLLLMLISGAIAYWSE